MPKKFSQTFWIIIFLAIFVFLAIMGVSIHTIEAVGGAFFMLMGILAGFVDPSPFRRKKINKQYVDGKK